jgi:hypothetical protein
MHDVVCPISFRWRLYSAICTPVPTYGTITRTVSVPWDNNSACGAALWRNTLDQFVNKALALMFGERSVFTDLMVAGGVIRLSYTGWEADKKVTSSCHIADHWEQLVRVCSSSCRRDFEAMKHCISSVILSYKFANAVIRCHCNGSSYKAPMM